MRPKLCLILCALSASAPAYAQWDEGKQLAPPSPESALNDAPVELEGAGRPQVILDRLTFKTNLPKELQTYLKRALKKEAYRADWGAGRENRIEYRFTLQDFDASMEEGVLHVSCTALGQLPKGKSARSEISFGGRPSESDELKKRVLRIVARGVITRLAQLERTRRGLR